jgi:hypothetical protein
MKIRTNDGFDRTGRPLTALLETSATWSFAQDFRIADISIGFDTPFLRHEDDAHYFTYFFAYSSCVEFCSRRNAFGEIEPANVAQEPIAFFRVMRAVGLVVFTPA